MWVKLTRVLLSNVPKKRRSTSRILSCSAINPDKKENMTQKPGQETDVSQLELGDALVITMVRLRPKTDREIRRLKVKIVCRSRADRRIDALGAM